MPKILPWLAGGLALAAVMLLTVAFVKPIGVSTQFVIADAIVWDAVDGSLIQADETAKSGYASSNAYLNKSGGKYAKNASNPWNYSFVFVIAMMAGAFLSSRLKGDKPEGGEKQMPHVWRDNFGGSVKKRYAYAFLGGFLVLFASRLAGGCTSGHMLSGMMQTSLSGYLFALGTFGVGVPTAIMMYRKGKGE